MGRELINTFSEVRTSSEKTLQKKYVPSLVVLTSYLRKQGTLSMKKKNIINTALDWKRYPLFLNSFFV